MRRKLVKQGNNAMTVTVPHLWVKRCNLKPGSEVAIEEKGRGLYIDIIDITGDKKEIAIPSIDKFMRRLIHAWYTQGYDELKVSYHDVETINLIRGITPELLGFEIVEQGSNYCIIKNIGKESEAEFDPTLRKIFLMILSIGAELLAKLKLRDFKYLSQIANQDTMVNKLAFYCERLLTKYGYPADFKKSNFMFTFVWTLEQIADEFRDICREAAASKRNFSKAELMQLHEVNELVALLHTTFYKQSLDNLIALNNRTKELYQLFLKELEKGSTERLLMHHLIKISDKINSLTHFMVS